MASLIESRIPLWLDCDPGHDDAFAILFSAYHPALHLIGVSTVYGNAPLSKTTSNALSVLQAIGKSAIPVHPGSAKPFCREVQHAADIHGESGLDGTELLPQPVRTPLTHCNAIKDMRDALMACPANTAWLVTCGTLTNAALLFAQYPEVASHIKGLSIMGGSIGDNFSHAPLGPPFTDALGVTRPRIGNWSPYAEFNIHCDPESAQSILSNSILAAKTILIPLDLTHQAFASPDICATLSTARDDARTPTRLRRMFNELLMFFANTYADVFGLVEGPPLHDPLAVAVLLAHHENDEYKIGMDDRNGERWNVDVVLQDDQIGRTKIVPSTSGTGVTIPRSIDLKRFWSHLEQCLAYADEATGHAR